MYSDGVFGAEYCEAEYCSETIHPVMVNIPIVSFVSESNTVTLECVSLTEIARLCLTV
jgi:hypothetical protein